MKEALLYKKLADRKVYPVKSREAGISPKAKLFNRVNPVKSRKAGALPLAEQFNRVKCQNCAHYCVIQEGKRGICGVRENRDGKLYSLVYGKACALNIDPIEKKPFFHFLPGTKSLSVATVGCNFRCFSCQNHDISQMPQLTNQIEGEEISPEEIVKLAQKNNLPSISYTYTEPTIFSEYALDTMKLARRAGLKNNWVTNGFMSKELFDSIYSYLDAVNIDLKSLSPAQVSSSPAKISEKFRWAGFGAGEDKFYQKYCGGRLQPVLDTLIRMKKKKIWVEVTTLVIPTLNDSDKVFRNIAKFIKEDLGPETPWHLTQFCGTISWKLQHLPNTPMETLEKARKIGLKTGLKYVYSGNIPGVESEDTFCPKCGVKMIDRTGYLIERYDKNGKCAKCGTNLDLILK